MTHRLRTRFAAAASAVLAGLVGMAGPAVAAPRVELDPPRLPRGADAAIPYVRGTTLVDGTARIRLDADAASLLGMSGADYVVWTSEDGSSGKIVRVSPSGVSTVVVRGREAFNAVLSADGGQVALPRTRVDARRTTVTIHDSSTGAVVSSRTFKGFADVLDIDAGRALVGTISPARTVLWDLAGGQVETISRDDGYEGDLSADRLAVLTGDPFRGGCSVVSSVSDPGTVLSESCTERVYEFAPDGSRMALVDLLTDGLGPSRVTVRRAGGRKVATYDAPFFFGLVTWETSTALLMQTNGPRRSALVRCTRADCDRASRLTRTPDVRRVLPPSPRISPWRL